LDLEFTDEPLFVLASAHLQLGLLYQRQDRLYAAQQEFRSALKHFPHFVAALTALGQVRP
jgi:Tfp pilus assembly protein PilF